MFKTKNNVLSLGSVFALIVDDSLWICVKSTLNDMANMGRSGWPAFWAYLTKLLK